MKYLNKRASAVRSLLAIGALSYLIYSFASFISPEFAARLVPYIQLPSLVGEGALCLVLLVIDVGAVLFGRESRPGFGDLRR